MEEDWYVYMCNGGEQRSIYGTLELAFYLEGYGRKSYDTVAGILCLVWEIGVV